MSQLEEMQVFVRIVEAGSITKAADQLNTVKSSVSKRLSELERRLGLPLLRRTTRSQHLTDSGKSYYHHCLRILDDIADMEAEIKDTHRALSGKIKVAAPLSFGIKHLGCAIRKFTEMHPDIFFDVDFNDRKIDIVEEGFDFAIRIARLEDSSYIAKKLTPIKVHLCASASYIKNYGKPKIPEDLVRGHVKLQYTSAPESWHFKSASGKNVQVNIPSVLRSNNGDFLSQAAVDGFGLAVTPDFISYEAIRAGDLKSLLSEFLVDNKIYAYALYPQGRHLPLRVRSFIDFLSEYYGDKPYWAI